MGIFSDVIDTIFNYEQYMPHGYCLLWQPDLVWMHVISDLTVTLSYYSIPITILYMLNSRKQKVPYRWVFIMFSLFIFLCGTTHLLEIFTLWYPMYYLEGVIKALTAAASLATAILIFPLVPILLEQFGKLEDSGFNPWNKSNKPEDNP